jgi:hypothetical protein
MAHVDVPVLTEVTELRRLADTKRNEGRTIGLVGTSGGVPVDPRIPRRGRERRAVTDALGHLGRRVVVPGRGRRET